MMINPKRTLVRYRAYRNLIHTDGVKPISFLEWWLGRVQGKLAVSTATSAMKRGDFASFNHGMLSISVGNQSKGRLDVPSGVSPHELNLALKEGRVRIVIDEPAAQ